MGKPRGGKKVRHKVVLPALGVDVGGSLPEPEQRTERLTMRLTPTERRQLRELAEHFGTTSTNVLMHLIRQAWEALHRKGGR